MAGVFKSLFLLLICLVALFLTSCGGGSGGTVQSITYKTTVTVSQTGGDYTDPLSALNDIASWCGLPSSANRCLIKLSVGTFNLGNNNLQMQSFVDIEGAGQNDTTITGSNSTVWGLINGADNAELRAITIENTGGGAFSFAITNFGTSPRLSNIKAIASGGADNIGIDCEIGCTSVMNNITVEVSGGNTSLGFYIDSNSSPSINNAVITVTGSVSNYGIDMNNNSSPTITNVTILVSGGTRNRGIEINGASSPVMNGIIITAINASSENYGIYNINSSSPVTDDLRITSSGGTVNYGVYSINFLSFTGGIIQVDNSEISGSSNSVFTEGTYTAQISNTTLTGSVAGTGTNTCSNVYDEFNTLYPSSCP